MAFTCITHNNQIVGVVNTSVEIASIYKKTQELQHKLIMPSDSYVDKTMYKIEDFSAFQQTSENLYSSTQSNPKSQSNMTPSCRSQGIRTIKNDITQNSS
jgi:hypothetical protein